MIQKAGKCNIMDNIEKNRYVRTAITEALLDLLAEKELDKITVSEITAKEEVGRVTLYRNYKTKDHILKQHLLSIIRKWSADASADRLSPNELIRELFQHMSVHKDFYTLLYQKDLFYLFRDILEKLMVKDSALSNPEAYAAAFASYGLYGWIREWLARGMQESPEELYAFLNKRPIA